MNDPFATLTSLLCEVILPNLKEVQMSQAEQMAASDRLERAIEELRTHLESQFALFSSRLTACQVELSATQAALKAAQSQLGIQTPQVKLLIH